MDIPGNLAFRMRPQSLDDYAGQEHLIGKNGIIRKMIESGTVSSMIFWGPPGSGKTTLAYLIAKSVNAEFHALSGVTSGKKDLMEIIEKAQESKPSTTLPPDRQGSGKKNSSLSERSESKGKQTILFIDEI